MGDTGMAAHRILIADCDHKAAVGLGDFLTGLGYLIELADTGDEILSSAMRQPIDLFILDVHIAGQSGAEVFSRLRALRPEAEFVFLTNSDLDFRMRDFLRFWVPAERLIERPQASPANLTRTIIGILGPPAG